MMKLSYFDSFMRQRLDRYIKLASEIDMGFNEFKREILREWEDIGGNRYFVNEKELKPWYYMIIRYSKLYILNRKKA